MVVEGIANCIAISKDGKYLAVGIVQDLNIYEIRGDIETDLSLIWLMKKFYCLHKDRIVDIEFWINSRGLTLLTGSCDKTIRFINLPNCEISKTECDAESKFFWIVTVILVQEIVVGNDVLMGAIHPGDSVIYTCEASDDFA
jgi:WD40 repeat protein